MRTTVLMVPAATLRCRLASAKVSVNVEAASSASVDASATTARRIVTGEGTSMLIGSTYDDVQRRASVRSPSAALNQRTTGSRRA